MGMGRRLFKDVIPTTGADTNPETQPNERPLCRQQCPPSALCGGFRILTRGVIGQKNQSSRGTGGVLGKGN
jgi:hypothetical protein